MCCQGLGRIETPGQPAPRGRGCLPKGKTWQLPGCCQGKIEETWQGNPRGGIWLTAFCHSCQGILNFFRVRRKEEKKKKSRVTIERNPGSRGSAGALPPGQGGGVRSGSGWSGGSGSVSVPQGRDLPSMCLGIDYSKYPYDYNNNPDIPDIPDQALPTNNLRGRGSASWSGLYPDHPDQTRTKPATRGCVPEPPTWAGAVQFARNLMCPDGHTVKQAVWNPEERLIGN